MSILNVNTRYGEIEGIVDELPTIEESLTLYDYEKHDLTYWVNSYDLVCAKNFYDALSKKSLEDMKKDYIDAGYTDVKMKIDHLLIGRMNCEQKLDYISMPASDRCWETTLKRLFECDFILQLTPIYYWSGGKGTFEAEMVGHVPADDIKSVVYYKQKRWCDSKMEFDNVSSIYLYNDVRAQQKSVGEIYMDFYSNIRKDEGLRKMFTMSVPDLIAVVYDCRYTDSDGKKDGRLSLYTWSVDKEDVDKANEYLKENWPKEMDDYREY